MDKLRPFDDPRVAAIFAAYPEVLRERLLRLRALIFESADDTKAVGPLIETVKWGQASYVPQIPKVGTTVRIDALGKRPGHYAALFHCQTSLVSTFRELYPDLFEFEGNRALIFGEDSELPRDALKHCFSLALTYHARRKAGWETRDEDAR